MRHYDLTANQNRQWETFFHSKAEWKKASDMYWLRYNLLSVVDQKRFLKESELHTHELTYRYSQYLNAKI